MSSVPVGIALAIVVVVGPGVGPGAAVLGLGVIFCGLDNSGISILARVEGAVAVQLTNGAGADLGEEDTDAVVADAPAATVGDPAAVVDPTAVVDPAVVGEVAVAGDAAVVG